MYISEPLFDLPKKSHSYSRIRERTAPDIGGTLSSASHFHLTKSPSGIICIPPSNGALKPFDGITQTKKRLGYPNRFCLVSTKKHRSKTERCLVREMGLEPTRHRHTHLKRACLPIPALPHKAMPWHCKKYFSIPAAKKQGLFGLFFKLLTTVPSRAKIVRYTASFIPFSRIAAKNFNFFQNIPDIFP